MSHYKIVSRFDSNKILYEGEAESLKDLIGSAVKQGADLQGANLQGADLQGADLQGANLQGADLQGANLWGADLQGANLWGADLWRANLWGANLQGADLWGANLWGANLQGANLQGANLQGFKVKTAQVFTGLYSYIVVPFVTDSDERRIVMGCYNRSLAEWESDFWNNLSEFPNDNSEKSRARLFAFQVAKKWLDEFVPQPESLKEKTA